MKCDVYAEADDGFHTATLPSIAGAVGRLPLMEISDERVTDFLVTPSGKIVSGVSISTYVLPRVIGAKKIQLHQVKAESVNVLVELIPGADIETVHLKELL